MKCKEMLSEHCAFERCLKRNPNFSRKQASFLPCQRLTGTAWHQPHFRLPSIPNPRSGIPALGDPGRGPAGSNLFRSTVDPGAGDFFPITLYSDGAYVSSVCLSILASLWAKKKSPFPQQPKTGKLVLLCHIQFQAALFLKLVINK